MAKIKKSNLAATVNTLYAAGFKLIDPSKHFTDLDNSNPEASLIKCSEAVGIVEQYDDVINSKSKGWPSERDVKGLNKLEFFNQELRANIEIAFEGDCWERKLFLCGRWDVNIRSVWIPTDYKSRVMSRNDETKQLQAVEKAIQAVVGAMKDKADKADKKSKLRDILKPAIKHFNQTAIILICDPIEIDSKFDIDFCSDLTWASAKTDTFKMGGQVYQIFLYTKDGEVVYKLHKNQYGTCIETTDFDALYNTVEKLRNFEEHVQDEFDSLVKLVSMAGDDAYTSIISALNCGAWEKACTVLNEHENNLTSDQLAAVVEIINHTANHLYKNTGGIWTHTGA